MGHAIAKPSAVRENETRNTTTATSKTHRFQMHSSERRENQKDHALDCRERGAAHHLAEHNRGARHGRDEHGKQKPFLAVFDHRHHGEDGSEEHDHDQRAGIKIIQVMLLAGSAAGAKRSSESRADHQPEHQRRRQHADHARGLAVEAHDLAPPQRECRQRYARGCGPSHRSRQSCCLGCHYGFAFAAGAEVVAAGFGAAAAFGGLGFLFTDQPAVAHFPIRVQQETCRKREQDERHEKPVDRDGKRRKHDHATDEDPDDARKRQQPEHQRKHQNHWTQATSSFSSLVRKLVRALHSRTCGRCDG